MKRRLLSAFLAVMMVLTMAPVAFAAEGSEVSSPVEVSTADELQSALTNAKDGTVIKLTDNITVSSRAKFSGQSMTVTLDLNNYTLTGSDSDYALSNENGDGATTGKLIVKNGTIKRADDVKGSNSTVRNYGQMELNNVQVQGNYIVVKNEETATLIMNDCTLTAPDVYGNNQAPSGLQNWGTATANNCSIKSGTAVMAASWADSKQSYDSNTSLNNCTISGSSYAVSSGRADKSTAKQIVTVNGGSYTGNINSGAGSDITINAEIKGKMRVVNDFSYNLGSASYITSGPSKVTLAEGGSVSGTINAAAKNGNTYYSTVTNAVEEATNGNTIELVQDTTEDVVIPADKTITLDLNGKKLTNVQSDTITVTKGATLTINGKGTVDNVTHQKTTIYNKGTVTLNGGTYDRSKEDGIKDSNTYYTLLNHGTMTVANVTVNNKGGYSSLFENGYFNQKPETKNGISNPILTINSGNFTGGINTVKNDDDATMIINDGTFANYAQAAFQNHNIATINGGTFDGSTVYAILNCGVCTGNDAEHDKHQLIINDGKFSGKIRKGNDENGVHYDFGSIAIKGGYFTTDPSKYLATYTDAQKKYIAKAVTGDYKFHVELADANDLQVVPVAGATAAPSKDELKNNKDIPSDQVDNIVTAAKAVSAPEISKAAQEVAANISDNSNTLDKQYQDAAKNEVPNQEKIEVRTYLDVEPKAYNESAYTLDITPKYDVVVVGTKADGTTKAEKVVASDTLKVTNATNVSIQLPAGFVSDTNTKLYVQHKGHEYDATVTANNGVYTANFTNPHGFSPFTISKTPQTVATIGTDKYTSFADAVSAVPANGTIEITGGTSPYTGTANKTFTVKNSTSADITVNGQTIKRNESYTFKYTHSSGGSSGGSSSGKTTYKVTTSAVNNGGVNASPSNAEKGAAITITLSPDKGYKLDKLTVTDGSGKTVSTVKKSDTVYTFTMPASAVKVGVSYVKANETPSETKFNDVSANDWFASAVDYVTGKGMMNGTADNTFSPKANTTRGMVVTVLYRLENQPSTSAASFTDVASGAYYANAVAWANANGIVSGYGSGKFGPNDKVTREQLAAILYRYAQYKKYDVSVGEDTNILSYNDAQSISSYAIPAIQWACGAGVVTGKSGSKLDPKGNATRAEVAAMLMRFCENVK